MEFSLRYRTLNWRVLFFLGTIIMRATHSVGGEFDDAFREGFPNSVFSKFSNFRACPLGRWIYWSCCWLRQINAVPCKVDAFKVAIPCGTISQQHVDQRCLVSMISRKYCAFFVPVFLSIEWWRLAFYIRACQSVTIDMCKVYSVQLELSSGHCHAFLLAFRWERYCVLPRS